MARDSRELRTQSVHHTISVPTAASSSEGGEITSTSPKRMSQTSLNESPRPKAGKFFLPAPLSSSSVNLNESPRPKAGKCRESSKGKSASQSLNESPRPKAGKFVWLRCMVLSLRASMKVPARRRGNEGHGHHERPLLSLNESPRPKAGKLTSSFSSVSVMRPQ